MKNMSVTIRINLLATIEMNATHIKKTGFYKISRNTAMMGNTAPLSFIPLHKHKIRAMTVYQLLNSSTCLVWAFLELMRSTTEWQTDDWHGQDSHSSMQRETTELKSNWAESKSVPKITDCFVEFHNALGSVWHNQLWLAMLIMVLGNLARFAVEVEMVQCQKICCIVKPI